MKPRLCRSSWRAFASTHPLMLPSTSSREALLACPLCPPWNLLSFTVESTLSTSCSRSDPLFLSPRCDLDSLLTHNLVLWIDGSVPFPFGKGGSGVLSNCFLCGAETTLSFSAGPVCSSFSAEACVILHALCWSRQHQQVCHFSSLLLLSDFCSVLAVLSSPPSFFLSQTLWQIWQELSPLSFCSVRLQWIPEHSFLRATTRLMSWPDGERYLRPPQSLVVSLLLSLVSTLVLSRIGGVLSHRNILKHRFSRFPLRNLCSLVTLAVSSRLRCNGHSLLLGFYLSRIGRIENPSCSASGHSSQDTSHLIVHCPATDSLRRSLFGDSLSLYDLWSRPWRVSRLLGHHGLPPCPHPSEGVG